MSAWVSVGLTPCRQLRPSSRQEHVSASNSYVMKKTTHESQTLEKLLKVCTDMKLHIWLPISTINSNFMVILNRFGYRPLKTCVTWIDLSRSLKIKDNGAKWNFIYDFLSTINSNFVVILNRFGDIGHWKPVSPGLTFQGHSRSKKRVPNETSYMTSYMWIMVTNPYLAKFSRYRPKQCYHGG